MTDLFRSALSYIGAAASNAGVGGAGEKSHIESDFVGNTVEVGPLRLYVRKAIAEGKNFLFRRKYCTLEFEIGQGARREVGRFFSHVFHG